MSVMCLTCGGDSRVLETRRERKTVKRKRRCLSCTTVWFTHETRARSWSALGPTSDEHKAKISAGRIASADQVLANKIGIPVEMVADYRWLRSHRAYRSNAAAAVEAIKEHVRIRGAVPVRGEKHVNR